MLTEQALAVLTPEERAAFTKAAYQVAGDGFVVGQSTAATLVLTIERLLAERPATPERMLREFHSTAGLPLPDAPTAHPELGSQTGRAKILAEEVRELGEAIEAGDIVKIADASADIVYAVVGTAVTYGVPFDAVLAEVHRSNMTKLIPPIVINGDGKIMKGPRYEPPDIAGALAKAAETDV